MQAESLQLVETASANTKASFPYTPRLFSLRELPAVLGALEKLEHTPDLIICDDHGIAHPGRLGQTSHLGVLLDISTIGCAKTALLPCSGNVSDERGSTIDIFHHADFVGKMLRTHHSIYPDYVSPGHKITISESIEWVLTAGTEYRLPETIRLADQLVRREQKK